MTGHLRVVARLTDFEMSLTNYVSYLAWLPDGTLLTNDSRQQISIWDLAQKCVVRQFSLDAKEVESALLVGWTLVVSDAETAVKLWDVQTAKVIGELPGHETYVDDIDVTPDGRYAVTAERDGKKLRVWDFAARKQLAMIEGHEQAIYCCAISPDGTRVASGGKDGLLRLWDANTGKKLKAYPKQKDSVFSCAFSPDGKLLAAVVDGPQAQLWDVESGKQKRKWKVPGQVRDVGFVDAETIWTIGGDKYSLWNLESNKPLAEAGPHSYLGAAALTPDRKRVITGAMDGRLRVWELAAKQSQGPRTIECHKNMLASVDWVANDRLLLLDDIHQNALIDTGTGKPIWRHAQDWECRMSSLALSPDRTQALFAGQDGVTELVDVATGKAVRKLKGEDTYIGACVFLPGGVEAITGEFDRAVRWNLGTGKITAKLKTPDEVGVHALAADGQRVFAGAESGTIYEFDLATNKCVRKLVLEADVTVKALALSDTLLVAGGHQPVLKVWDRETGELRHELEGHDDAITGLVLLSDGRLVSGSDDGKVMLWDTTAGKRIGILAKQDSNIKTIALSPDGTTIASATINDVTLIPLESRVAAHTPEERETKLVAFSPDGKLVVSQTADGALRVRDRSGKDLARGSGAPLDGEFAAFTDDGKRIVAGGNGAIVTWNLDSATQLETVPNLYHMMSRAVAFDADGKSVVVIEGSKILRVPLDGSERTELREASCEDGAISVDRKYAIVINDKGKLRAFPLATKGKPTAADAHTKSHKRVASGGDFVATCAEGEVKTWKLPELKPVAKGKLLDDDGDENEPQAIAMHPDGSTFVVLHRNTISLFETKSCKELARYFTGHADSGYMQGTLAFASDGTIGFGTRRGDVVLLAQP